MHRAKSIEGHYGQCENVARGGNIMEHNVDTQTEPERALLRTQKACEFVMILQKIVSTEMICTCFPGEYLN